MTSGAAVGTDLGHSSRHTQVPVPVTIASDYSKGQVTKT